MSSNAPAQAALNPKGKGGLILAGLLVLLLGILFFSSFKPGRALFSNDGPLAVRIAAAQRLPAAFFGVWNDLYWLGADNGSYTPTLSGLIVFVFGPVGAANFYTPIALLVLGLCAWVFFRQLNFRPSVCVLGGLAAALNMNFFSNACWGLPTRALSLAMTFLALAAVHHSLRRLPVVMTILAGLAVGMSVLEGADNGAIFSLFVAAYVLFSAWLGEGAFGRKTVTGLVRLAVVAGFAAFMAYHIVSSLVGTQIKGIVEPDQSKEARWDWATQWSLPKLETLRVAIPGLSGYRMDTPNGGQYWGRVGESPQAPDQMRRFSGAGEYAGVLVLLAGAWAVFHSFTRAGNSFSATERKFIWFWSAMALVALLLSWGRFAPFYQVIYALPYFSTIRNPMKFMHPFHLALMILFAYGLQGLWRRYLESSSKKAAGLLAQTRSWWKTAVGFDKFWATGCGAVLAASVLAYLVYSTSRNDLVQHLTKVGFEADQANAIVRFSVAEVGLFVLFLALSIGAVTLIQSGALAGARAKWAALILGLILVVDLARANKPWIQYYDYQQRYATNPLLDVLKDKPYQHRVVMPPGGGGSEQYGQLYQVLEQAILRRDQQATRQFILLNQLFQAEWVQHQFQYYNIQSLNVSQEPRLPADKAAYLKALGPNVARYWQLTNARFILGMPDNFLNQLNNQIDPGQRRFRVHTLFNLFQHPGSEYIGVQTNTAGPFALIEFTGALPRAKLYRQWQVTTNEQDALAKLAEPGFDPAQLLLVSGEAPAPAAATASAADTVEFVSYSPRQIELRANSATPAVLLLNDRFDPGWKVWVDNRPAALLRGNYIMRGVHLPSGQHTITFRFRPSLTAFYVSSSAIVLGLMLCGYVAVRTPRHAPLTSAGPSERKSQTVNRKS